MKTTKTRTFLLALIILMEGGLSAQTVYTVSSNLDIGAGTLRQLIADAAPGDSIVIPADYTILVASELAFSKNLKINGQGATVKVTNPGESNWRVFTVGTTASIATTVSMYNLNLQGGYLSTAFGATVWVARNHTFTMKNCTVSKGKATYTGGIFCDNPIGTTINIDNCFFSENESTTANGGACILKGISTITNCTYINNKAAMNGSAIASYSGAKIKNCKFINNSGNGLTSGCVINYSTSGGPVDMENCIFESNTLTNATGGAGAFAIAGATCSSTLTNCTFYKNVGQSAGAIYNAKGRLNLVNCTFAGNSTPTTNGGAFFNMNHADAKTTMVNNIFAYNYNSAGLMDVYVNQLGIVEGTNNVIGASLGTVSNPIVTGYSPLSETKQVIWGNGFGFNSLSRFPAGVQSTIPADVWNNSLQSSGMQVRFKTNASSITIDYSLGTKSTGNNWFSEVGSAGVDLYARNTNGEWLWCYPGTKTVGINFTYAQIAPGDPNYSTTGYEFCLYLPSYAVTNSLKITVNTGAKFEYIPVPTSTKPIVIYGTSIVHGAVCVRPGNTWTNIVSRRISDRQILNMGFSGSGRVEPEVVKAINQIDADIYVLDCLPNMTSEELVAAVEARYTSAVDTLLKYHPNASILLSEHQGYADMEMYNPRKQVVLDLNNHLKKVYDAFIQKGYKNIYYLTREELGLDMSTDIGDYVHPNDKGMYKYADAYTAKLNEILTARSASLSLRYKNTENTSNQNPVDFSYDPASLLFERYTDTENKMPILEDNGTIKLISGSIAINAGIKNFGNPELVPLKDQLGVIRSNTPSLGAVEFVESVSGVANINAIQLDVYPNPATEVLYFKGDCVVSQAEMFDLSGKKVLSVAKPMTSISLNGISRGIYFVHVLTTEGEVTKKISIK